MPLASGAGPRRLRRRTRRLTDAQIDTVPALDGERARPRAKPADLPPLPRFPEGWRSVRRISCSSVPRRTRFRRRHGLRSATSSCPSRAGAALRQRARAQAGQPAVVHHANVLLDRSGSARQLDATMIPFPGFGGMKVELESDSFEPRRHFLFWKPGTAARHRPRRHVLARSTASTDLVLNLHLKPSGKPETLRPVIGLYFTVTPAEPPPDAAPARARRRPRHPARRARASRSPTNYRLPLDVSLLGVYPHAHYLGKRDRRRRATLPRHEEEADPDQGLGLRLAGRLPLRASRSRPCRRAPRSTCGWPTTTRRRTRGIRTIRRGGCARATKSTDEMSHLWVQVLPRQPDDRKFLQEAACTGGSKNTRATSSRMRTWAPCWRHGAAPAKRRRQSREVLRPAAGQRARAEQPGCATPVRGRSARIAAPLSRGGPRAAGLRERPLQPGQRARRERRRTKARWRSSARSCGFGRKTSGAQANLGRRPARPPAARPRRSPSCARSWPPTRNR